MGRGPIPRRPHGGFPVPHLCAGPRIRHYHMFPCAIPDRGAGYPRVTHPSAASVPPEGGPFARLACLRRAASVRSEPGSNSPSWSPRATRRGAIFQIVVLSPSDQTLRHGLPAQRGAGLSFRLLFSLPAFHEHGSIYFFSLPCSELTKEAQSFRLDNLRYLCFLLFPFSNISVKNLCAPFSARLINLTQFRLICQQNFQKYLQNFLNQAYSFVLQ